ncbi:hypothetical protein D8Y22_19495 [Salinadaptatus halalkaliphilus]|uniref:Uncharacterized protein n=1 Tax=Salinadaptatus halalkaliphilus TaxID=2419781 RepID=A0A4S3TH34_9EURY|nr:hypothetical protein D8Y22_19495 [Salinadaptatus halalkaliphilus]
MIAAQFERSPAQRDNDPYESPRLDGLSRHRQRRLLAVASGGLGVRSARIDHGSVSERLSSRSDDRE